MPGLIPTSWWFIGGGEAACWARMLIPVAFVPIRKDAFEMEAVIAVQGHYRMIESISWLEGLVADCARREEGALVGVLPIDRGVHGLDAEHVQARV